MDSALNMSIYSFTITTDKFMKNVLFVATVYKFFNFEKSDMSILKNMGYVIHTVSRTDV